MNKRPTIQTSASDFPRFIEEGSYYVDKTLLVRDIVSQKRQVLLYTRPRRFGKSLNQSMLQAFFDVQTAEQNKHLFDGLAISKEKELCEEHQGKYPVIKMSIAVATTGRLEGNCQAVTGAVREAISPFVKIIEENIHLENSNDYKYLINFVYGDVNEIVNADVLRELSRFLHEHYGHKCIVLLDEYDVPIQNAFLTGHYNEMISFIRPLLNSTFKDNPHVQWGVITGCLKIAKESIFTGLNNPAVNTILSANPDGERFGFTQAEVDAMLKTFNLEDCRDIVKEWYDGYLFGNQEVYNPFSMAHFVFETLAAGTPQPAPYWMNTSGNDILEMLLKSDKTHRVFQQMQSLLDDEPVTLPITLSTVYRSLDSTPATIWSTMLFTGYLKPAALVPPDADEAPMRLPNYEVKKIVKKIVLEWMEQEFRPAEISDTLLHPLLDGDAEAAQARLQLMLRKYISCRNFDWRYYQAFIHGLLAAASPDYEAVSDAPIGDGYPDIVITAKDRSRCVVLEVKTTSEPERLPEALDDAEKQFIERRYSEDDTLRDEYPQFMGYAVACCRKKCMMRQIVVHND